MTEWNPNPSLPTGERTEKVLNVEEQIEQEVFNEMVKGTIQQITSCIATNDRRIIATQIPEKGSEKDPLTNGGLDSTIGSIFFGIINQAIDIEVQPKTTLPSPKVTYLIWPTIVPGLIHCEPRAEGLIAIDPNKRRRGFQYNPEIYQRAIEEAVDRGLLNKKQAETYLSKLRY